MDPIVGTWESVDLCLVCGGILSGVVTDSHWGKPCHHCGAVGDYCPPSITTARRFITTKKNWFSSNDGYWEWSGKSAGGGKLDSKLLSGRTIHNHTATIAAAGIASGLF